MKFIICISLLMLGTGTVQAEINITAIMEESKIIPDVVSEPATQVLKVNYDSGVEANLGNELTPNQTRNQPSVDWNAESCSYYTLIIADPDAPTPQNASLRELRSWHVGNIPGKNVSSGYNLVEYIGAGPPRNAEKNRFIYLVFKQPGIIDFDEEPINKYTFEGRSHFSVRNFTEKYNLGALVAVNYFVAKYDEYVDELYEQMDCCWEYNM